MKGTGGFNGGGGGGGGGSNYRNPCLTMHQPWASLLVHGIKRIEGRSWPSPITGRLWIHAASKVPDQDTIKAMEDFYREIYYANGITNIKFPDHYPVSRLLGCVEVVGCLKCEELVSWEAVPESVRLEGLTDFCWLCEQPQKLMVPFEMRGYQRVYNLEKRIYDAALRGLRPVEGPQPFKFPLPNPHQPLSLRPGYLAFHVSGSRISAVEKPPSVNAAIAGARAAATQFLKKDWTKSSIGNQSHVVQNDDLEGTSHSIYNTAIASVPVAATQFSKKVQTKSTTAKRNHIGQNDKYEETSHTAVIAGTQVSAGPFSKKDKKKSTIGYQVHLVQNDDPEQTSPNIMTAEIKSSSHLMNDWSHQDGHGLNLLDQLPYQESGGSNRRGSTAAVGGFRPHSGVPSSKDGYAVLQYGAVIQSQNSWELTNRGICVGGEVSFEL